MSVRSRSPLSPRRSKYGPRLEKHEQADGVRLLETVGAKVYVLGTRRRKGDHQGTMQTPGIADVLAFLPAKHGHVAVWFEFKREKGGTLSEAQMEFRRFCESANVAHVVGASHAVGDFLKRGGWLA